MKILICGGRSFDKRKIVYAALERLHQWKKITYVIHGAATGADELADKWALMKGVQPVRCPANWHLHERAAGPIRNRAMLDLRPYCIVAFPGGKGTGDLLSQAVSLSVSRIWQVGIGEGDIPLGWNSLQWIGHKAQEEIP